MWQIAKIASFCFIAEISMRVKSADADWKESRSVCWFETEVAWPGRSSLTCRYPIRGENRSARADRGASVPGHLVTNSPSPIHSLFAVIGVQSHENRSYRHSFCLLRRFVGLFSSFCFKPSLRFSGWGAIQYSFLFFSTSPLPPFFQFGLVIRFWKV